jgi:hypothetical protein
MNIDDSSSTPNVHLPNVPSIKEKNYDANRKFKELGCKIAMGRILFGIKWQPTHCQV